jgi:3D (Asp-Asp-Asp) domain-containing protein
MCATATLWRKLYHSSRSAFRFAFLAVIAILAAGSPAAARHARPAHYRCLATAFAMSGETARGTETHVGVVAADPRIFPLGTRLQLIGAGISGTYTVSDTGAAVVGRHIDIYLPNAAAAKRFGKRMVTVRVLRWGSGERVDRALRK